MGLGEAGATVYVTGRTTQAGEAVEDLAGAIYETAEKVTELGDHRIVMLVRTFRKGTLA